MDNKQKVKFILVCLALTIILPLIFSSCAPVKVGLDGGKLSKISLPGVAHDQKGKPEIVSVNTFGSCVLIFYLTEQGELQAVSYCPNTRGE